MKKVVLILFVFSLLSHQMLAQYTALGGEWTSAGSWSPSGPPTNGSTITITSGVTITITNTIVSFNGTVIIDGTLSFQGIAARLAMDANSTIIITSGGQIVSSTSFPLATGIRIGTNFVAYNAQFNGTTVTGPATITEGAGILPVEIIFFEAKTIGTQVDLTWATATEENFDYFSVERSTDGEEFKEIAQIQGMGESIVRVDYNYTDEFPIEGISYYRLRAIDFDGYSEVFEYQMVEVNGVVKDFTIYPNPIEGGQFSLQTNFEVGQDAQLIVYNSMGVIEVSLPITNWLTTHTLQNLDPGAYLFRLVSTEGIMVKRVLIK